VLAESEWWAKFTGHSYCGDDCIGLERLAANRAKVADQPKDR
jgi:hypothetical protein